MRRGSSENESAAAPGVRIDGGAAGSRLTSLLVTASRNAILVDLGENDTSTARLLARILGAAGLAGCTMAAPPVTQPPVATPPAGDTCNAAAYQSFVGQRSPAITVPAGTVIRHYRTGDPVTMDLNAARINFEYDRSGRLVSVTCG